MNEPQYICAGCGRLYGHPKKSIKGYCDVCWDVWLARGRLGVAMGNLEWQRHKIARAADAAYAASKETAK